jgi:cell division GTPase FtsZ
LAKMRPHARIGARGTLIHVSEDGQMSIEEVSRVDEIVTEMIDEDALVIWDARVNSELGGMLKVMLVMTHVNSPHVRGGFGTIAPQLFNLEPYAEPEKPLDIKLNLYQMEPTLPQLETDSQKAVAN